MHFFCENKPLVVCCYMLSTGTEIPPPPHFIKNILSHFFCQTFSPVTNREQDQEPWRRELCQLPVLTWLWREWVSCTRLPPLYRWLGSLRVWGWRGARPGQAVARGEQSSQQPRYRGGEYTRPSRVPQVYMLLLVFLVCEAKMEVGLRKFCFSFRKYKLVLRKIKICWVVILYPCFLLIN